MRRSQLLLMLFFESLGKELDLLVFVLPFYNSGSILNFVITRDKEVFGIDFFLLLKEIFKSTTSVKRIKEGVLAINTLFKSLEFFEGL